MNFIPKKPAPIIFATSKSIVNNLDKQSGRGTKRCGHPGSLFAIICQHVGRIL